MESNLTINDIKESVEVKWRRFFIKYYIIVWLIVALFTFIFYFVISFINTTNEDMILYLLLARCGLNGTLFIFFFFIILYFYLKIRYLINNYTKFKVHTVVLNTFATSYQYRGSVYYIVQIDDENGKTINVKTNPIFSDIFFYKFKIIDFNNKSVVGLYDSSKNKFYIIKKV